MNRRNFFKVAAGVGAGLAAGGGQLVSRLTQPANAYLGTARQWQQLSRQLGIPVRRLQQLPKDVLQQLLSLHPEF